tara:strand:+ start:173 stop:877 length:705 start_codon:yes stop_codon:yes gene_type:complete
MANQLSSGSLDTLKVGQTLLTKVIKTKTNKIQIEIAERVVNPNSTSSLGDGFENALAMFNASDENFKAGKARMTWSSTVPEDFEILLNVDELDLVNGGFTIGGKTYDYEYEMDSKGREKEVMYLNILNPKAIIDPTTAEVLENPKRLRLRIVETVDGTDWDQENNKYKTRGKGGDPVLHNGNYIYFRNQVVFSQDLSDNVKVPHIFLASDVTSVTSKVEVVEDEVVSEMDISML